MKGKAINLPDHKGMTFEKKLFEFPLAGTSAGGRNAECENSESRRRIGMTAFSGLMGKIRRDISLTVRRQYSSEADVDARHSSAAELRSSVIYGRRSLVADRKCTRRKSSAVESGQTALARPEQAFGRAFGSVERRGRAEPSIERERRR